MNSKKWWMPQGNSGLNDVKWLLKVAKDKRNQITVASSKRKRRKKNGLMKERKKISLSLEEWENG